MTDTKKSTSMQSSEQGTPSSSNIEYWVEKQSGKAYASKNDGGQQLFHGPLSESQKTSSPSGFTYSPNPQISQNPENYDRMSHSEFQSQISQQKVGAGSSQSSS